MTSDVLNMIRLAVQLIDAGTRIIDQQKAAGQIPPEMLDRVDRERRDATRRFLEMARQQPADLEDDVDPAGR